MLNLRRQLFMLFSPSVCLLDCILEDSFSSEFIPHRTIMSFAVYWTGVFTILLIVSEKTYSNYCDLPIDSQCLTGCYYYHGNCLKCTNCTRDQLVDIERYHQDECLSFPAFCKIQRENVNWRQYATDFHPPQLLPIMDSFIGFYHRWLLIFFQEDSHPMIGKLCMNESQKIPTEWYTFQKARLKCTSQDGVIYSSLVAVKNLPYNTTLYLTLMSSSVDNKNQSALCLFTYPEIARVFNSNTYYDPDYSNEWRAVPSDSIPYGRYSIGVCSWRSTWTDQQKKFIRTHPLMYNNVTASQVLAERDGLFTALESIQKRGRDEKRHIMVFVGTDDGRILKYALIDPDTAPNFLEEIYFTQNQSVSITNLEIVGRPLQLKIWTTDAVEPSYEPLQRCRDMEIQCVCEQDPYCMWNDDDGSCRSFDWKINSIKQPAITKKTCEGIAPGSALLVTNRHGRPIITDQSTTTTATTVDRETTGAYLGPPNGPGLGLETAQSAPTGPWKLYSILLCVIAIVITLAVILFLVHIYWKNSPTNQDFALDHKNWTSDWTSITFNQKVPCLKLKDTTEGGTEYTGKVVKKKTVFEDLPPLTDYEVIHNSDRSPFLVSTKGPSFSDWGTTVDTVDVKTGGCQAQYESHLVLKCDGGLSHRMNIEESSVTFYGLIPNMKYVVWLEVCKKDSEKVIEKCITDVTTKEESFCVEMVDGKPCLMWSNLPSGIERYIQSCSCGEFHNFLTDINSLVSGSKELPLQPQHAKFNLKVMTKIPVTDGGELEHILASLEYETSPLALVKLPEQSSPFQSRVPEDSNGLVMTTTHDTLDGDDSSFRLHSLPVSEGDSEGSNDDSSSRIRSEPTLGSVFKEVAPLVSRQTSEGNGNVTCILAHNSNVILNSQVNVNNGSSTSSGIGSFQSSQSSFVDLPFKGYGLRIGQEHYQCSATLLSLTTSKLKSEDRRKLAFKIFLSKEKVIPCLCELLNYSRDEIAGFEELIKKPDDSLKPITEREVQSEQIFVVTLLYQLMEVLIDFSQSSQRDKKEALVKKMDSLYNVICFLATMTHGDCPACKAIVDSINHLWICGGFKEDEKEGDHPL